MDIITATVILMTTMNDFSANGQMVYNPTIEGNVVTSVEVMERQEDSYQLTMKFKKLYTYDDEERLVKKELLLWNSDKMEWQKSGCWDYTYGTEGYTVDFALWNDKEQSYTNGMERQVMNEGIDGTLVVTQYIRSSADDDWQVKGGYLMLRPDDNLLATSF